MLFNYAVLNQVQDDVFCLCHSGLDPESHNQYNSHMNNKYSFIYIITNQYNTVFYVGVTSNLQKRIWEHKNKVINGFSKRYNLNKLVYYEVSECITSAIIREKQLKHWRREWKIDLIKTKNPKFEDLYNQILL